MAPCWEVDGGFSWTGPYPRSFTPNLEAELAWEWGWWDKVVSGYFGCSKAPKIRDSSAGPLLNTIGTMGTPMLPCPLLHFHQC